MALNKKFSINDNLLAESDIIKELYNSGCLNEFYEDYKQPTPKQIKTLREYFELSQVELAKQVGVSFVQGKGSSTIRKWETDVSKKEHRNIGYAQWRLILITNNVLEK